MSEWVGIERLHLSPLRPGGALPTVPQRLFALIRAHGPRDPVVVRRAANDHFEILSNAETWLAVQRLGRYQVPIDVRDDVDDAAASAFLHATPGAARDDPITEARGLAAELAAFSGPRRRSAVRRLAERTGLSRTYISHAVRLLELPLELQRQVEAGALKVGHARPLIGLRDHATQLRLAQRIITERLTARAAEALARAARRGPASAPLTPPRDPNLARLEQGLSELLGCAMSIDATGGKLVIDYAKDLDVLDGVLARMGYRG